MTALTLQDVISSRVVAFDVYGVPAPKGSTHGKIDGAAACANTFAAPYLHPAIGCRTAMATSQSIKGRN